MTALLQTTYFGPIQWYQKLHRYDHCLIEQYDSFQKQTYRNRCVIATANGVQALTVPVITQHPSPITQHPSPNTQHPSPNTHHPTPNTPSPRTFASATTTNGDGSTGMPCRVPIARVRFLSTMLTTCIRSSRSITSFCSISTKPSVKRFANSSTFIRM